MNKRYDDLIKLAMLLVGAVVVYFVINRWLLPSQEAEGFKDLLWDAAPVSGAVQEEGPTPRASMPLGDNERPAPVHGMSSTPNTLPKDCFAKNQLSAKDLLPSDGSATEWAKVNPEGQGALQDKNFLNAGYHIGINTVGQSLRNANLQLRSEPPNPQTKVSPWMQTTIEPDLNRLPLEVGGCA